MLSHSGIFDVTKIEQRLLGSKNSDASAPMLGLLSPEEKARQYQQAPELAQPDSYLNTNGQPISLAQYKGKKVVLIDFWTYSCINCLRTIPYLNAWYEKYKDQGLVIVGVHTPEFAFEHVQSNVSDAITRLGIKYPVVQDNEYKTWNAFGNQYWPNEYLVDVDGYVVDNHAGEGDYDKTEAAIQQALAELASRNGATSSAITSDTVSIPQADLSGINSPETYFGYSRNRYFGNGTPGQSGVHTYALPASTQPNTFYLSGTWDMQAEYAESKSAGVLQFTYNTKDVYFVASGNAGGNGGAVQIEVWRDGKPVGQAAGADVDPATSVATIKENRLYHLIHGTEPGVHTIQIKVKSAGLQAFTFTFG